MDCQPQLTAPWMNTWSTPKAKQAMKPPPMPQRTQKNSRGSISSEMEPPWGSSNTLRSPSTRARAIMTPPSQSIRTSRYIRRRPGAFVVTGSDIELIPPKKCTAAQTGNSAMRYREKRPLSSNTLPTPALPGSGLRDTGGHTPDLSRTCVQRPCDSICSTVILKFIPNGAALSTPG